MLYFQGTVIANFKSNKHSFNQKDLFFKVFQVIDDKTKVLKQQMWFFDSSVGVSHLFELSYHLIVIDTNIE